MKNKIHYIELEIDIKLESLIIQLNEVAEELKTELKNYERTLETFVFFIIKLCNLAK